MSKKPLFVDLVWNSKRIWVASTEMLLNQTLGRISRGGLKYKNNFLLVSP